MKIDKNKDSQVKKTIYIGSELNKQIKIRAIMEKETESYLVNKILSDYFFSKKKA